MTTTQNQQPDSIANILWRQIEPGVKMSLGVRSVTALLNGVRAQVGPGRRRLSLEVTLNGRDLYDVAVRRLPRGAVTVVDVWLAEDVYAEDLNATLLRAEREAWGS